MLRRNVSYLLLFILALLLIIINTLIIKPKDSYFSERFYTNTTKLIYEKVSYQNPESPVKIINIGERYDKFKVLNVKYDNGNYIFVRSKEKKRSCSGLFTFKEPILAKKIKCN